VTFRGLGYIDVVSRRSDVMGVLLKSAMGLGTVYVLMFAPVADHAALGPAASLCAQAATAKARGDVTFAAQAQAARCAMALGAVTAPLRLTQAESLAPPPPRPAARPGGLTGADLAEPWFGPGSLSRKSPRRG
jgi:hypothetical protein